MIQAGRRRWIGGMAVALIGLAAIVWFVADRPDRQALRPSAPDETAVVAQEIQLTPQRTRIQAIGTARAIRSVTLYPASNGEVTALTFSAGDTVEKGETLLQLDERQAALDVELAQVTVRNTQQLLARYERIEDTGAVSASAIDSARNDVASAEIELKQARETLRDRTLRAPFGGHVGLTDIDVGDRITTTTAVTSLDDRSILFIDFNVPEAYIERIKIGLPVALQTTTVDQASTEGAVTHVDSRIDAVSRTVRVRAQFDNAEDRFRPGMSFEISLDILGGEYPVIPEIALQWGGDGAFLWTIEDGEARRVPALVVERQDGRVLVDADLEDGDLVVIEGVQKMRDGLPVQVEPADGEAETPLAVMRDSEVAG